MLTSFAQWLAISTENILVHLYHSHTRDCHHLFAKFQWAVPANRFYPFVCILVVSVLVCYLWGYISLEKTFGSSVLNINKSFYHMNKVNLFYLGDKVMRPTIRYFGTKPICLLSTLRNRRGNKQQWAVCQWHFSHYFSNKHAQQHRKSTHSILLNLQKRTLFFFIFITP